MVIHRLVPQANDNIANGLDVKVGCIVVVGDGDGQLDGVAPGKRGIERQQGCSHTLRTPPDHGMTGVEEAAVVRVLHVNLNAVGAVVGKREQVGVRGIARTLPNPVRGDANGRVLVRLNMQGEDAGKQHHHHAQ